jgi:hypothetical protein
MRDKLEIKDAYVYRHTKLGTNEVFYIGIGNKPKYSRAYTKNGRNRWWEKVVEKYGFEVEILTHRLTWKEACEIEILLIDYYKRADCCGGTLVNLTNGGDGGFGVIKTEESINKWRNSNIGKQDGNKNVMFGKTRGKHHLAKEVLNLETGIFYDCALDACENLPICYSAFKSKLNRRTNNDTSYTYVEDYENGLLPFKKGNENFKKVINTKTFEIFDNVVKASQSIGISPQTLSYKLNNSNNTDLQYLDSYNKGLGKTEKKRGWMKYVLDLETGVFYYSLSEATEYYPYTYNHMKQMLNNNSKCKNKTSLVYV